MSHKYAVIQAHRKEFSITLMCRVLEVSTTGFYAAQTRAPSRRAQEDERLRIEVRSVFQRAQRRYGAPRVHKQLRKRGMRIGQKRVARLMRTDGLVARPTRRFVHTTDSAHTLAIAPNLLARDFAIAPTRALDRVWVSDVTYIPTFSGWLYLAIVLDLASRRIVGWATSARNDTVLVVTAVHRALAHRAPTSGWMLHSDRGSTYASDAVRHCVAQHHGVRSMSRKGDCWDNAVAESFFATLEHELLTTHRFASHSAATRALTDFIDGWYNTERLHSALQYTTPLEFEQDLHRIPRAA